MSRSLITTISLLLIISTMMLAPVIGTFVCPEKDIEGGCREALSCLYPNPSDRQGFIQCDDSGQIYYKDCKAGLVWNDDIKNCDHPRRFG